MRRSWGLIFGLWTWGMLALPLNLPLKAKRKRPGRFRLTKSVYRVASQVSNTGLAGKIAGLIVSLLLQSHSERTHRDVFLAWWSLNPSPHESGCIIRKLVFAPKPRRWTTGELTIWLTIDDCLTVTIDGSKLTNHWLRVFIANNSTA